MNVIDGQAGLVIYFSLIFYSLTIDNILNIIVLLILAGVSIAMLTGDNGILTQANKSKVENEKATAKEKVEMEVAGSRGTDGKIDYNLLNDNLRKNVEGLIYGEEEISEDNSNRITSLPAVVNVDGYVLTIEENGKVTLGEGTTNEEIDWDEVLANATSPHPDQSETNTTIAVGTNGDLVNMDLWISTKVTIGGVEGYGLYSEYASGSETAKGYVGGFVNGEIIGKVPQYIKKEGDTEFLPVISMGYTFAHCGELEKAPDIPTTVSNLNYTFQKCTKLETVNQIPESVKSMNGTFYVCSSLTGELIINANIENREPDTSIFVDPTLIGGIYNCLSSTATNPDTNLVLKGSSTKLNELLATKSSNSNITIGN